MGWKGMVGASEGGRSVNYGDIIARWDECTYLPFFFLLLSSTLSVSCWWSPRWSVVMQIRTPIPKQMTRIACFPTIFSALSRFYSVVKDEEWKKSIQNNEARFQSMRVFDCQCFLYRIRLFPSAPPPCLVSRSVAITCEILKLFRDY